MKINVQLPFDHTHLPDEFMTFDAVREVCQTAEHAGFNGGNVTDHPCPSTRWLEAGGHDAQDPFVMLSLVAGVTTTLRLQTGILVLPYRNPFLVARSAATLDVFSGGRLTLGIAVGYMKSEYKALGVDFDTRNDLTDEYLRAMKAAWSGENFTFEGTGYSAVGNRINPPPRQKQHPPLLIGGNSNRAIRRAVDLADGWTPFPTQAQVSATARTATMGMEELKQGIAYMRDYCDKVGRETMPEIFYGGFEELGEQWNPQAIIDRIGEYRDLGVTGLMVHLDGSSRAAWCDQAERFGTDIISKLG